MRRRAARRIGVAFVAVLAAAFVAARPWLEAAANPTPPVAGHEPRTCRDEPAPPMPPARTVASAAPTAAPPGNAAASGASRRARCTPAGIVVHVETATGPAAGTTIVATHTTAALATRVAARAAADADGAARLPRAPASADDVVCVDVDFPTIGAYARQVDGDDEALRLFVPARGVLRIDVREADGAPRTGPVRADVRVVGATPPADRWHTHAVGDGCLDVAVEAAGLALEVRVETLDGRRAPPVTVLGPAATDAVAECVVRLPARAAFALRALGPGGAPLAGAGVEVRLARTALRLDDGATADERGVLTFPAPTRGTDAPWPLRVLARTGDGHLVHGELLADLRPGAPGWLGDVRLEPAVELVRGVCVDEHGAPLPQVSLVVQVATARRSPLDSEWCDLALAPAESAADGSFVVHGPPPDGRALRLRVRGRAVAPTPFGFGAAGVRVVVGAPRSATGPG